MGGHPDPQRPAHGRAGALDLIKKNPCDHCKPPKIKREKLNVLDRAERTRMLKIAQAAEPSPLALAVELALTTGMRRGKSRCPSAEPGVDLAAVLRELADKDVYKNDYVSVTMDLLYDEMHYDEAVQALRDVADFVDGVDWN